MSPTNIVLLLEGKDYEQETLAKASRLAQGLGANLTLLHLTHSSKTRRNSLSLSQEERSPQGTLDAKAIISELITQLSHPVDYQCLVVDDVVPDLQRWLAAHPADLLLVGRLAQSRRLTPQDPLPERVFLFLTPRRHPPPA